MTAKICLVMALFSIPCGTKFLRVLIFAIFAVFPAIHKNKFPQIKNLFMLSVRISSYGCTREVWRARKMRKSCTRR